MQSALFDATRFTFDYDAALTGTAAEALATRRGNCVSFTNLFIAMARSQGLRVEAGYIQPRGAGERHGDLIYLSTHVVAVYPLHDRFVVFDFYRTREDRSRRIRLLDDLELAALHVNNRAVHALSAGDYAVAEALFNAVLRLAPRFAAAEGNLGVLLRRRGDIPGALGAYRRALALAPRDPSILGNLAALYTGLGREREAMAALRLADLSLATPFTILARGDLEAADGRVDEALRYYRRAARLDRNLADPHVAIARLARAAGRLDDARRAAERAVKLDPENGEAKAILAELPESVAR
jgi:Flp pilus assembly protein TadD